MTSHCSQMLRHVFSDTHECFNEMPTVLSTIARIHSHGDINFLPFHVLLASHEKSPYIVKTRTLSEARVEGPQLLRTMRGQNSLRARAAYSAKGGVKRSSAVELSGGCQTLEHHPNLFTTLERHDGHQCKIQRFFGFSVLGVGPI